MPSQVIREKKVQKVNEIKEMLSSAQSFIMLDYQGISVAQDTEMRNAFRNSNVIYHVMKNRLVKLALNDLGYTQFDEALNGTTAIAIGVKDIAAPAKIAFEKSTAFKKMKVKCGMVDGTFLSAEQCKALSTLPSKEILIAQLLGMLQAPIASFARVIDAIAQQKA